MIEEEKVSTTCRHVGLLFSFALCRGAVGWWLAEVRRLPDRAAVTGAVDNDGQSCRFKTLLRYNLVLRVFKFAA